MTNNERIANAIADNITRISFCTHDGAIHQFTHWRTFQDKPTWSEELFWCSKCEGTLTKDPRNKILDENEIL